jgi:acyl carrier protein
MDHRREPVPVGVVGELYIGGAGVTRGYLGRPELTAERFVPDPWSGAAGARLYRTGDLARYRCDGNLEFLGRCDEEVKIRGHRLHPGEVEATLRTHAGVGECAVVAQQSAGGKRLMAYLGRTEATAEELRSYLRERLPEYMIPSGFIRLGSLPMTANGKVDRSALILQNPSDVQSEHAYVAPKTDEEKALAEIWKELLGQDRIGAEDHFIDLGGHSLMVIRLINRVREIFGVRLVMAHVFEAPTIASQAALILRLQSEVADQSERIMPIASDHVEPRIDDVSRLSDREVAAMLTTILENSQS